MLFIFILGTIILPITMFLLARSFTKLNFIYNIISLITFITFGNIAAISIYNIIRDGTVFTAAIHALFLNPLFLITGAYLGLYSIYRLILLIFPK